MTPRIKFIFISTFFMGVLTGAYVFITFFAPEYVDDGYNQTDTLRITGEAYGGCSRGGFCSSFQLKDGGVYQYVSSEDAVMEVGTLPLFMYRNITNTLTKEALTEYAKPRAIRDCSSYVDGIDYAYTISMQGTSYKLDTCTTSFPQESTLHDALRDALIYMSDPTAEFETTSLPQSGGGFNHWLIDRFQNN